MGAHLDEPEDDAPKTPAFTSVMPTLLGGAHPDTFPVGLALPSLPTSSLMPVSLHGGEIASDIPATDEALHQDGAQLAQAAPTAQSTGGPVRGRRGMAPLTEPAPGSPTYEAAMDMAVGKPVVLPNGSRVVDETSPTGFLMSPVSDLREVAAAGKAAGDKLADTAARPISPYIDATGLFGGDPARAALHIYEDAGDAIRQGGRFDYQRKPNPSTSSGFLQLPHFRNVSNFNVGLYMQQAGIPLWLTLPIAGVYARKNSSNYDESEPYGLSPRTRRFIEEGYRAGQSGIFDASPGSPKR